MIEALLGVAGAVSKPLNDLYELGKKSTKPKFTKWKTSKNINALYQKISTVQKVKTIWQIDKEVNLKSFYYPSRLLIDGNEIQVSSVAKIPDDGNVVIQGTVGQGKSILMRYLCSQELRRGKTIPIFFELRKIQGNENLRHHINLILDELDFDDPSTVFSYAAKAGLMTVFLDGFDEVEPERIMPLISELEHLSKKYEKLKIIVSSRPDSGIEKSSFFRVYKVCPLNKNDHAGFLEKLLKGKGQEQVILDAINASQTQIQSLLTTPLMISLLVITYKSEQKIPSQISEFYENLFQILLSRHDKTKPGYSRYRKCKDIAEKQLQEIFEAFCYLTSRDSLSVLSPDNVYKYSKDASEIVEIPCIAENFVNDICKVACVILEDGLNYHFIHKSVQEYYCASFIKRQPDELAKVFYSSLAEKRYEPWRQVLNFCNEVDNYRLTKYFTLPHLNNLLNLSCEIKDGVFKGIRNSFFSNAINSIQIRISRKSLAVTGAYWGDFQDDPFGYKDLDMMFYKCLIKILAENPRHLEEVIESAPANSVDEIASGSETTVTTNVLLVASYAGEDEDEELILEMEYLVSKLNVYSQFKNDIDYEYSLLFEHMKNLEAKVSKIIEKSDVFEV